MTLLALLTIINNKIMIITIIIIIIIILVTFKTSKFNNKQITVKRFTSISHYSKDDF